MPRYRKKIISGDIYEIEEYFSPRRIGKNYFRGKNENLTTEEQKKLNLKIARRNLSRLINTNFNRNDMFVTLTFKNRVGYQDTKKELAKFFRKARKWLRDRDKGELKYIAVTEFKEKREHHHVVMTGMNISLEEITEMWGNGRVLMSRLEDGDYTGLANYITKEPPFANKKRWSQSKNLEKPKVILTELKSGKAKKLVPPKGYDVREKYEYFSQNIGEVKYIKCIRIGGMDYGENLCGDDENLLE